jgi:exopolyphosphatase / guanosine-5'-triphosphate,3'-diphosphate pyrophosphatase
MPIKYNTASADYPKGLIGIIDIGSNSVRMVVYHALKRVPLPLFNEKYMCGLGRGLARTGRLSPAGVASARIALARFLVMAERLQLASLDILATAAVRDAEDGRKFVKEMEEAFGVTINVISGEREAELAAGGIIASVHDPLGISADLGGGSMELASVERHKIGQTTTCKLGSLRILDASEGKVKSMQEMIRRELKSVPWLKNAHPHCLYAIGGGFRNLAKLHMRKTHYPLNIVHEYVMSRRSITQLVEKLVGMSASEIANLPGISQKRAPTIVPTALVLQQLLEVTAAPEVMFSVSGIREGFFYDLLSPKLKQEDALLASATDLAALIGRQGEYAEELFRWMDPLFSQEPIGWRRLRQALSILSELAWSIDPNFRAQWAYHRIIQSSLKGMDHKERIMLALALYHRYQTKWKSERTELKLLDERERLWARCAGLAANLAFQLSGGRAGNLHHAEIRRVNGQLTLALDAEASPLRTETVEKRLDGLGEALKAFSNFVL